MNELNTSNIETINVIFLHELIYWFYLGMEIAIVVVHSQVGETCYSGINVINVFYDFQQNDKSSHLYKHLNIHSLTSIGVFFTFSHIYSTHSCSLQYILRYYLFLKLLHLLFLNLCILLLI